jgi:long-chain fatty acid transport protein
MVMNMLRFPSFYFALRGRYLTSLASLLLLAFCHHANATNGFNLIGFGAESTLMGGADTAVARDSSALNTNPAGLTQIQGQALDMFGSLLRTLDLAHKDSFANDVEAANRYTGLGGGGYAKSLESLPCTVGVGVFAQGGAGGVYKNVKNAFGTSDELSSLLTIAKVIPGIGCRVNERVSIGLSTALVYSSIDQQVFANTSLNSGSGFSGTDFQGASALRPSYKIGLMYQLNPKVTLAATYTGQTALPLTGGNLKVDYTAQGFGKVKYRDASMTGFALPREVALGVAYRPDDAWLLSLKLNWINWSNAINSIALNASNPDAPAPAPTVTQITAGDWSNQLVVATGLAYQFGGDKTLYVGYNFGKNPVPAQNSSPLLAAILEHHITAGLSANINQDWRFTGGLEYVLPTQVNYKSPLFGDAEVRNEALFLHMMLSRRW